MLYVYLFCMFDSILTPCMGWSKMHTPIRYYFICKGFWSKYFCVPIHHISHKRQATAAVYNQCSSRCSSMFNDSRVFFFHYIWMMNSPFFNAAQSTVGLPGCKHTHLVSELWLLHIACTINLLESSSCNVYQQILALGPCSRLFLTYLEATKKETALSFLADSVHHTPSAGIRAVLGRRLRA